MFSYLYRVFFESSEDRLRKFRITHSELRAEFAKLQQTSSYLTKSFYRLVKSPQKADILERANNLNFIYTKCNAYEKIIEAGSTLIQRWELFDQCKQKSFMIDQALFTMHKYSHLLEQPDMIQWIKKAPLPNQEVVYEEYQKITYDNLVNFIRNFCSAHNIN